MSETLPARRKEVVPFIGEVDPLRAAELFAKSGYFKDAREVAQAFTKIMYGRELGVGPVTALMSINIIEGRPAPSANLLAAMVKRSGIYDYRVRKSDAEGAEVEFFQRGESLGISAFTIADAATAQLSGKGAWAKYPKAMLFNRAMTQGVRMFAPELFGGAPVYDAEELEGETWEVPAANTYAPQVQPVGLTADGAVVRVETGEVVAPPKAPKPDVGIVGLHRTCADLWKDLGNTMGEAGREQFNTALADVSGDELGELTVEGLTAFKEHLRRELADVVGQATGGAVPA